MADLRITAEINDRTAGFKTPSAARNNTVTTSADNWDFRALTITQAGEITFTFTTDIGNAGYCYIRNTDATNYVRVGFATTVYYIRILAGQSAVFPLEPTVSAIYLIADTADCVCEIYVREA